MSNHSEHFLVGILFALSWLFLTVTSRVTFQDVNC